MPQQAKTEQRPNPDTQLVAGLVEGVGRSLALSVEVFLHRGFGSAYVGCGPLAFLIMFLFVQFFYPAQDLRPLAVFAGIYGVLWLIATINVLIRWWRGVQSTHSRYNGRPHLSVAVPTWKEMNVKHLESLLVILLGFGIHHLNRPLGAYLILAGAFVLLRGYSLASMMRQRAVELNDAVIEQKEVAEQFGQMQQDSVL
jgi:hypothetical protein